MGPFADWDACKAAGNSDAYCGALKAKFEQKLTEIKKLGMLTEMVDWTTYVRPGEKDVIHGELLHPTLSGNLVEYTADEIRAATNTLIGKPIYEVYFDEITNPSNLHRDPKKRVVGKIGLVRWADEAINFIGQIHHDSWLRVENGELPQGSIEAEFAVEAPCTVGQACRFKPEFLQFTGYLLLPEAGRMTPYGMINPPGDNLTRNKIYEQIAKDWNCQCPSRMLSEQLSVKKKPTYKIDFFKNVH